MSEYRVVEHTTKRSLEEDVNNCLDLGWTLVGGVSVALGHGYYPSYSQAMVKENGE